MNSGIMLLRRTYGGSTYVRDDTAGSQNSGGLH